MIVEHVYAFTEFQGLLMRKRVYVILIVPDKSAPGVDLDKVANYLFFFLSLSPLSFLISFTSRLVFGYTQKTQAIKKFFLSIERNKLVEHIVIQ